LQGKKIIIGVTGSIAAYKAAYLTRAFIKQGADVKVIMTPSSTSFISPLTLSTLSKHPVYTDVIDDEAWNNHVDLGLWADVMIVAPATASTISKMASGQSDNIITAVYLSARCPVFVAPAMDLDMWAHPATQRNIELLKQDGNHIIDVGEGELASGLSGKGRMAEPDDIVDSIKSFFQKKNDLTDKQVLITAGPTYEALDPVRYIGNHSTGKMGVAIAQECASRGANVTLILGPSRLNVHDKNIKLIRVTSGDEMYKSAEQYHDNADIVVFTAAVADYKPSVVSSEKIKKKTDNFSLDLVRTTDIAGTLGTRKKEGQIHVGFALETTNEEENAKTKLNKKNFDLIVLNSLKDPGAGFKADTNKITIFSSKGSKIAFELKSKVEVATDIINTIVNNYVKGK
jgi:phosphopantothenoylcysteine decarboxylase/phosphopantothenate--cysteine ligase